MSVCAFVSCVTEWEFSLSASVFSVLVCVCVCAGVSVKFEYNCTEDVNESFMSLITFYASYILLPGLNIIINLKYLHVMIPAFS